MTCYRNLETVFCEKCLFYNRSKSNLWPSTLGNQKTQVNPMETSKEQALVEAATVGDFEQLRSLLASNSPDFTTDDIIQKLLTAVS